MGFTKVDCQFQVKAEYPLDKDIVLVARPDFVFQNFIVETKFPFAPVHGNEIPLRYIYQLETYYRVFDYKKVYLGLFSVPFNLKLIQYTPSNWRWRQIKKIISGFHNQLLEIKGR